MRGGGCERGKGERDVAGVLITVPLLGKPSSHPYRPPPTQHPGTHHFPLLVEPHDPQPLYVAESGHAAVAQPLCDVLVIHLKGGGGDRV